MPTRNRQWILKSRPHGMVSVDNFEYREVDIPAPDLDRGDILVRNLYLSFDPAMRGWMEDAPSYLPPVALNEPMRASSVGQVMQSQNPELPVGSLVQGMFGWQDYALANPADVFPPRALPDGTPLSMPLSVFGGTGLTAYFGLLRIGAPQAGETVVVSGAAGATGSVVVQIAKLKGCRVIGIAGGPDKCAWLVDAAGVDAAIDYKTENVEQRLGELCPHGINVFFDNVGGDILQAAITHIAQFGRIVMCGQISQYNNIEPQPGPNNLMNLVKRSVKMQGFIMFDFMQDIEQAIADLGSWVGAGKIVWKEDIQQGFDNIPATLLRLFAGKNHGKQLLKIADPDDY
ncbi:MAG: NADP-dependent oxidoreductase [Pseudomonadales bacterium]